MDRLRILFFTSGLSVGGAEHHLLELCRYLARAGHEPFVCTMSPNEDGLESRFLDASIPLYRLPLRSLSRLPSPRIAAGLKRVLASSRPDIIHSHLYHAEATGAFASLFCRAPLVTTRHSAGLEFHGGRKRLARLFSKRFAACVAVSEEAASEAVDTGFPRDRVVVLPNAVDTDRFRPVEGAVRESRRRDLAARLFEAPVPGAFLLVGSVGGLKPVKNYRLFLKAASRLLQGSGTDGARPALRFAIFGEGEDREELHRLARELGIEGVLSLPGRTDSLEELYPLLDIFVLTSSREGVPLALLEAMSSGVACAASAVGGIPGVLADAGLVVPPGDVDAFSAAMQRLVQDNVTRIELGRRARVRMLERYGIELWGERMLEIYRRAARRESDSRSRRRE